MIYCCTVSYLEPEVWQLYQFIVPEIIVHCKEVAFISLHYDHSTVKRIEASHKGEPKKCCQLLLGDWLSTNNGVGPKTWETLLKQLKEFEKLAASVEEIDEIVKNLRNNVK